MNYSHKIIATLFIAALPLAYACRTAEVNPADFVTLAGRQSARLESGVNVSVDSIYDNRCPIGAACFIAGWANAVIQIQKGTDAQTASLRLGVRNQPYTGGILTDSIAVILNGQSYKIILRNITPYPDLTHAQQEAKRAVIQVSKI